MLLVIIGAGASYDSAISRPLAPGQRDLRTNSRPPLANGLFQEREVFFTAAHNHPHFQPLVHRLRPSEGRSIEAVLEAIATEAETYPKRKAQLLSIRYYIKSAITSCVGKWLEEVDGSTNYRVLLDLIQQFKNDNDHILLTTFNYDTLIERALQHELGYKFDRIDDYAASSRRFPLFKLHGSTDWSRYVQSTRGPYPEMIQNAERLVPTEIILKEDEALGNPDIGWGFIPAIAIPVQTKQDFECPAEHLRQFAAYLPKVKKILMIGWRGLEEHFIKILNQHLNRVESMLVVSKDDTGEIAERFPLRLASRAVEIMKVETFDKGFSEFIDSPAVIRDFLKTQPT
jgi:hypothetical protein